MVIWKARIKWDLVPNWVKFEINTMWISSFCRAQVDPLDPTCYKWQCTSTGSIESQQMQKTKDDRSAEFIRSMLQSLSWWTILLHQLPGPLDIHLALTDAGRLTTCGSHNDRSSAETWAWNMRIDIDAKPALSQRHSHRHIVLRPRWTPIHGTGRTTEPAPHASMSTSDSSQEPLHHKSSRLGGIHQGFFQVLLGAPSGVHFALAGESN